MAVPKMKRIGIVSVEGTYRDAKDFSRLRQWGYEPFLVDTPECLSHAEAVIIPGGDSAVILNSLVKTSLAQALKDAALSLPIWGLCAGMVVMGTEAKMAENIKGNFYTPLQCSPLGILPVVVERLAWGLGSFIVDMALRDADRLIAVGECYFADAPGIVPGELECNKIKVLAVSYWHYITRFVAVAYGKHLGTSFWRMDERMEQKILAWWLNSETGAGA